MGWRRSIELLLLLRVWLLLMLLLLLWVRPLLLRMLVRNLLRLVRGWRGAPARLLLLLLLIWLLLLRVGIRPLLVHRRWSIGHVAVVGGRWRASCRQLLRGWGPRTGLLLCAASLGGVSSMRHWWGDQIMCAEARTHCLPDR